MGTLKFVNASSQSRWAPPVLHPLAQTNAGQLEYSTARNHLTMASVIADSGKITFRLSKGRLCQNHITFLNVNGLFAPEEVKMRTLDVAAPRRGNTGVLKGVFMRLRG